MLVKVKGMHCASCEKLITMEIEDTIPGAKVRSASFSKGTVDVDAPQSALPAIRKAIASAGYEAVQ